MDGDCAGELQRNERVDRSKGRDDANIDEDYDEISESQAIPATKSLQKSSAPCSKS
jgi:hypothetical protein